MADDVNSSVEGQNFAAENDSQITEMDNCLTSRFLNMKLRPKKKKDAPPRTKKSHAQYQAEYRARLKTNPDKWQTYLTKQKQFVKNWRSNLTQEKAEDQKQKCSLRKKLKRVVNKLTKSAASVKNAGDRSTTAERTTRAQVADHARTVAQQREYWRKKQKERREKMTQEEKDIVNARSRERYAEKKQRNKHHQESQTEISTDKLNTAFIEEPNYVNIPHILPSISPAVNTVNVPQTESVSNDSSNTYHIPSDVCNGVVSDPSLSQTESPHFYRSPSNAAKYCSLYRSKQKIPQHPKTKVHVLSKLLLDCASPEKAMLANVLSSATKRSTSKSGAKLTSALHELLSHKKSKTNMRTRNVVSLTKQKVIEFYKEESVDLPGQKHYSKRMKIQKKILTVPVAVLYQKFVNKHPDVKVSKRHFFRCRPNFIMRMKNQKFIQCLCEICENSKLKLNALKACGLQVNSISDALDQTLCPKTNGWWMPDCVARRCNQCGIRLLKSQLLNQCKTNISVSFKEWKQVYHTKYKVNRTELVEDTVFVKNLIDLFLFELKTLSLHVFTAEWQRHQFKTIKNNLPADTAVILIDFSENYTCRHQREVAAAHWSYNQVTVHPVVVYMKCPQCTEKTTCYYVFLSDDLNHDSNFVFHVLQQVMSVVQASKYIVFSDNCSVQYKSKLPFHHMSQLANTFNFERCYFGERHGKNECDSCGGMIKSFLSRSVLSGKAVLRNASDIVSFLNSSLAMENNNCSHHARDFHLVNESDIDRSLSSASLKTLPGTKKIHSFKVLSSEVLSVRQFSCFCSPCLNAVPDKCVNKNIISDFEKVKWPNAKSDDGPVENVFEIEHEREEVVNDTDRVSSDAGNIEVQGQNNVDDGLFENFNRKSSSQLFENPEDLPVSNSDSEEPKNNSVKRALFVTSREVFFKDMYEKFLKCESFSNVRNVSEAMLPHFKLYSLSIASQTLRRRDVDLTALQLLPPCKPTGYLPAMTVGDGNCMTRAVSRIVFGHEDGHIEIRCRITAELSMNKTHYLDDDFVSIGCTLKKEKVLPLIALLSDCHNGEDTYDSVAIEDIFEREVYKGRQACQHLGVWQLMASASILKHAIISLYPQKGSKKLQALFGRSMLPRGLDYDDVVYVMWSSSRQMAEEHWVANHVVPLLKMHK